MFIFEVANQEYASSKYYDSQRDVAKQIKDRKMDDLTAICNLVLSEKVPRNDTF